MTRPEGATEASGRLPLPSPIVHFMVLALALTIGCLITEVVCGILKLPYPYDWPLMPKEDPFRDFYLYQPRY